jgi:signal transduction histidine kinase
MEGQPAIISANSRARRTGSIIAYALYVVTLLRLVLFYQRNPALPLVIALLAAFLALSVAEPFLARRFAAYLYPTVIIQTLIVFSLGMVTPIFDFTFALFIVLGLQLLPRLTLRRALVFYVLFSLITCVSLYIGMVALRSEALPRGLSMIALGFFLGWFIAASDRAEVAREQSRRLLAQLQEAHARLELYAGQAEELAAARERNRLARELHDSVTQSVFSVTLLARSARILAETNPAGLPNLLDQLQELTSSALAQMRSLITELRPK